MTDKKIAFIRMWPNPPMGKSVAQLLQKQFPDYHVDIFDLDGLIEKRLDVSFLNSYSVMRHYGLAILTGYQKYHEGFRKTPYFFKKSKEIIVKEISKKNYAFTFQMQSLIDGSTPGVPHFVYTDHTMLANQCYPGFHPRQLPCEEWIRLEKTIYQNATLIFTLSQNISGSIIDQYLSPPEKVICVYAGGNVQTLEDGMDDRRYERKNILFVGKDWDRKGGPELMEAFKIVLQSHPDAHLTIVGCSPRLNVPNCTVVGQVPLGEVSRYYMNASVFCLPTKLEPFGSVFVEAQTYKLPVVATDVGAIPDFIIEGYNGHLVKPNHVEGIAEALSDLINNPEKCRTFGENGYRLMKGRYTWDKVGERMRRHIQPYLN
jgi:glycosyltransferase involved in cell wall biosynthesis